MTIAETLARLQDDHDEDPVAAARALRELNPVEVPRDEFARYSWLLNHVLGQKLGEWKEVQRRYGALAMPLASLPIAALRNVAAAAALAGDAPALAAARRALSETAKLSDAQATAVVRLAELMYDMDEAAPEARAREFVELCGEVDGWDEATAADAQIGAITNNIVSEWLELPPDTWRNPDIAAAMEVGALTSGRFWARAGTWLQAARADYLVAMAMNRLGKHDRARAHAASAISRIQQNGRADVDLAFILLELAHAEARLGNHETARGAREQSESLSAAFPSDSLRDWYASRAAVLDGLSPRR